ncbi:SNF2-related protein [Pedobacter heparinus DSM 2366]|uniref:SNF2-related protein n=1 Tax=Pedobacter heparinus (strain ATCC 13125 / DSM 2366 / CIP 104194 / JCM 7457 / NBRC 12017 / NCIMB 9290 / NRRL B-14731 / HIM 762-3) TaxID=485917 RepID=C6XZW2_PEDHD|nr:SNF2-related protein [Pedobacter heparinus DSM 2366]
MQVEKVVYTPAHDYILADFNLSALNLSDILKHNKVGADTSAKGFYELVPAEISLNFAVFGDAGGEMNNPLVTVTQTPDRVLLSCSCPSAADGLCEFQARALYNIMERQPLRLFFDAPLRHKKLKEFAQDYGLEQEKNPDDHFELSYIKGSLGISPKVKTLFPVTQKTKAELAASLLPKKEFNLPVSGGLIKKEMQTIVVFSQHRYYSHLNISLYEGQASRDGKIKNPLKAIDPSDLLWTTENISELKFLNGVLKFQNNYNAEASGSDLEGLRALARNPLGLDIYLHDPKISPNISATSISRIKLKILGIDLVLSVNEKGDFYEVSGKLMLDDQAIPLENLSIKHHYFIQLDKTLHLIDKPDFLRVIEFFKKHYDKMLIHRSKFDDFYENILSNLEEKVRINYAYLKPATKKQIEDKGYDLENEQLIYLSESEDFVLITPVMRYSNTEIPVLSRKQIIAKDKYGHTFSLRRDEAAELQFIADIAKQHPFFEEQQDEDLRLDCFYMHRKHFLDIEWFLNAFEAWRSKGITILGFNQLKNNNLSQYKANISIKVISGVDWFETKAKVEYNDQAISLKHLHKSIRNKSKFVKLDDGTMGILPDEWIEKFTSYFNAGELVEESIHTHKINYNKIAELYDEQLFDESVKDQLALYRAKLSGPESILPVPVPEGLNAELRGYQQDGLNWLNFLDGFNFGACLADDMGLGKTIQIIAFILSQRNKGHQNTNLVVVPASLIFNWQAEVAKFAPSLKIHTVYGADRLKDIHQFDQYEIVLTSYGTLLADIRFLKSYYFNYIFLDESQTIKNPDAQRYKAVRLLQSRNKVVLTGTPIENNTYDLYGQLSFACPGLLGSRQQFKELYAVPIDQFKDSKRAKELQKKISPFILRRTKEQVAKELPDKTEMVIYCEMGTEQREVYEAAVQDIKEYIEGKAEDELAKSSMYVLQGITRLRQICNSATLLKDDKFYGNASSKMEVLLEQIESKSPNHKILVFSQFVGMLDLIRAQLGERGIAHEYLTGQTRNRQQVVNSFQDNPEIRVFLISLKAGGVGLNLTRADYVYLVDPWWNPAVENQAIDRTYRIGQEKNVVAVRLICPDTIEEKIMKLQNTKRDLVDDLIKTDVSIYKTLSKKDLLGLFS